MRNILLLGAGLFASLNLLHAQLAFQSEQPIQAIGEVSAQPDSIVCVTAEAQGLPAVTYNNLPLFGTYWEVMPSGIIAPLPCPPMDSTLPIFCITGNIFLVDATGGQVNTRRFGAHGATMSTTDALTTLADAVVNLIQRIQSPPAPAAPMMRMSMRASSLASTYAYGNQIYITNLVTSVGGASPVTASFSIGGGTNFVPWDILTSTNIATPRSSWDWLGIGYTSNRYTFSNQPASQAFYVLAQPTKTMIVPWGDDFYGQCDIWSDITNAVQVTGGIEFSLALLNDGTVTGWGYDGASVSDLVPTNLVGVAMIASGWEHNVALRTNGTVTAWGDNFYGEINLPAGLSNVMVISAQALHSLALKTNGTVIAWGYGPEGETNVPTGLTNVTAISAGGEHNLAVTNGLVVAWGYNGYGQCTVPAGLSNVWDVAAGWEHSMALKKDGTVVCWGHNSYGECNVPAGLSNVVAIAAGGDPETYTAYSLALKNDGTVTGWGNSSVIPAGGLNDVIAIGSGASHALAIRTGPHTPVVTLQPTDKYQIAGGNVTFTTKGVGLYGVRYQWQTNGVNLAGATNTALTMTNVQATTPTNFDVVVTDNAGLGSVTSSVANFYLITPPVITYQSAPTNIICIYGNHVAFAATASAPGQFNGFPLSYQWKLNGTNISGITTNAYDFFAADNLAGTYTFVAANAAGSASVSWQVTVTNAINVTNDLLLIYNTNSADSTFVKDYYLAHRPNVAGANVLGIGFSGIFISYASGGNGAGSFPYTPLTNTTVYETITYNGFTNQILAPVQAWLNSHPTKHPQYVILFLDVPSRVDDSATNAANYPFHYPPGNVYSSASYQLATVISGWKPFVTHINMNGTNDCIGYINKLASLGTPISSNNPILSASAGGYGNTNWCFDDTQQIGYGDDLLGLSAEQAVIQAGYSSNSVSYKNVYPDPYNGTGHISNGTNIVGYFCWGAHSYLGANYAIDGDVKWTGSSGWWIIETVESFNGHRYQEDFGNYIKWFSPNAFGGTNYSNSPIGAISNTDEPYLPGINTAATYFGLWAAGKNFGICAWNSRRDTTIYFQVVGDPLVTK